LITFHTIYEDFDIFYGKSGKGRTWQSCAEDTKIKCKYCNKDAHLILVYSESAGGKYKKAPILNWVMKDIKAEKKIEPHDAMAIANYFCFNCGEITSVWDQA